MTTEYNIRALALAELEAAAKAATAQHERLQGDSEISLEKRIQQFIAPATLLTIAIYDLIDCIEKQKTSMQEIIKHS
jgi:hypothetical protein